jgi:OOP family OmpA-OmpF porin
LITGRTLDEAVRAWINAMATDPIDGYNEAVNITVPDTAASFAGTVESQTLCQSLMDEIKGQEKVFFESAKADILPESFPLLNNLVSAATQCPAYSVAIHGHTDSDGAEAYNMDLSQRRATTVMSYLSNQGVAASRMSSKGFGESQPVATNETSDGKAANRRIEFIVTKSE